MLGNGIINMIPDDDYWLEQITWQTKIVPIIKIIKLISTRMDKEIWKKYYFSESKSRELLTMIESVRVERRTHHIPKQQKKRSHF